MNRKQFLIELAAAGVPQPVKLKFFARSPWQVARRKPEFVGWEAWVYSVGGKKMCAASHGYVITQEDWDAAPEYRKSLIEAVMSRYTTDEN